MIASRPMTGENLTETLAALDGGPMRLAPSDIHCWLFGLDGDADDQHLDEDEKARAARFKFDRDRRRFIAGHDAVRRILARYADEAPVALAFTISEQGRPAFADGAVNFNYSRSEGWGLLGVSKSAILGVDIEAVRMTDDLPDVARRNFSETEIRALSSLAGGSWSEGFFACWTRKEAVVKAAGEGLLMPLQSFDVTLAPGAPAAILRAEGQAVVAAGWTLSAFRPLQGFHAAVAADLAAPKLQLFRVSAPAM